MMKLNLQTGLHLACNLFEYGIISLFFRSFLQRRWAFSLYKIPLGLAVAVAMTAVNGLRVPALNTAVYLLMLLLVTLLEYRDGPAKKLALVVIAATLSTAAELFVAFLSLAGLDMIMLPSAVEATAVLGSLGSKLILLGLVLILRRLFSWKLQEDTKAPLALSSFSVMAIVSNLTITALAGQLQPSRGMMLLIIAFLLVQMIASVFIFFIYGNLMVSRSMLRELELGQKTQEMHRILLEQQERSLDTRNALIHDYHRHLQNIRTLIVSDPRKALAYADKLCGTLREQLARMPFHVENTVVSSILERVRRVCDKNKIECRLEVHYSQLGFIDMMDASVLLDNAFDNALEACLRQEQNRWLHAQIDRLGDFVLIKIGNSLAEPVRKSGNALLSAKRGYRSGGYGLRNMAIVASKYGGGVSYHFDPQKFELLIRLHPEV